MIIDKTPEQSKAINDLNGPLIIISATGGRVLHRPRAGKTSVVR